MSALGSYSRLFCPAALNIQELQQSIQQQLLRSERCASPGSMLMSPHQPRLRRAGGKEGMSHPPTGEGKGRREGTKGGSAAAHGVNSPRVGCCCTSKSDNRKVKRARSVYWRILKVASGLCPRPAPWRVPARSSHRPSGAAEPEPPAPARGRGSPREREALPTALISGSRQLCDPFSLSSRFSPVTYRLRDNSPTLSPSVATPITY